MFLKNPNHRQTFSDARLVFMSAPEKMEIGGAQKQFETDFLKDLKIPKDPKAVNKFIHEELDQKFGPDAYETAFQKIVQKYIKSSDLAARVVKEARLQYEQRYQKLKQKFINILKKRAAKHYEVRDEIKEATHHKLSSLLTLAQKGNQVERLQKNIESSSKVDGYQVRKLVYALNEQYLNADIGTVKPTLRKRYRNLKWRFEKGMNTWVSDRAWHIEKTIKDPKKQTEAFKKLATVLKEHYARLANNDGIIDYPELNRMDLLARRTLKLNQLVQQAKSPEDVFKILESSKILRPRDLQGASVKLIDQFMETARRNGAEQKLIDFINKETGEKYTNFNRATRKVRELVTQKIKLGVKEAFPFIQKLNQALHKESASLISDIEPQIIQQLVVRERRQLLEGRTVPTSKQAIAIVKFMRASRGEKIRILKEEMKQMKTAERLRQPYNGLFQAIQDVAHHYPETYAKRYQRGLERIKTLKINKDRSRPTGHEKIARLLALGKLAEEAKSVIQNYSSLPDFNKESLAKRLNETNARQEAPKPKLLFTDTQKTYSTRYKTFASRLGFSGKELALTTAKVWAGITIFMNFMNYRREKGLVDGTMALATNPYIYGAGGVYYAVNRIRENPENISYFRHTEGGQRRISHFNAMSSLARKVKKRSVMQFIGNANEFSVIHSIMNEPQGGAENVKEMLKQANKNKKRGESPVLTKKNLVDAGVSNILVNALPDKANDRMRYLFYAKFLMNKKLVSTELEDHVKQWGQKQ